MEDYNSKTRAQLFDIIKQLGLKAPSASAKKQILVDILSSANTVPLGSIQVDANQGIAPSVEPLSCIELDLVSSDEVSHQHSKVVKSDDISCLEQVQDLPFENEPSENATEIIIQDLATTESSNIPRFILLTQSTITA